MVSLRSFSLTHQVTPQEWGRDNRAIFGLIQWVAVMTHTFAPSAVGQRGITVRRKRPPLFFPALFGGS